MSIRLGEGGELDVPGLHDAELKAVSLTSTGVELSLKAPDSDLSALCVVSPRPWVWSEGVVVPNIVHHAFLAQPPVLPERFAQFMGKEAVARFFKDRDVYAGDGWVLALNMVLGGQLVLFGSGVLRQEEIVILRDPLSRRPGSPRTR